MPAIPTPPATATMATGREPATSGIDHDALIRSSGISSATTIGLLTAVPYVFGAIAMVIVGRVSDASGERRKYVAGLLLAAAFGFFAAGLFDKQAGRLILALG